MGTQSTPPRNTANDLAEGGIVSRRDLLKGALVGAGALAALSLPTPLTRFFPAVAPREALGANNNVADGIYLFRYNAAKGWSLDVPNAAATNTDIKLDVTNGSISQCCAVTYDSSTDAYRIAPICGITANMVLTSDGNKNSVVKMRKDTKAKNQRWLFVKNSNGSYSIKIKSNTSLCVNLLNDNRSSNATIQLYTYSSSDIASQWQLICFVPAQTQTTKKLTSTATVFNSSFLLENVRTNYPTIVSKPSGWTVENKSGHPYRIKYNNGSVYRGSGAQSIVVKYSNVGDVGGVAVDFQAKIDVYPEYNDSSYDNGDVSVGYPKGTCVDLQWESLGSGAIKTWGMFAGICVTSCSYYDVTYTCYNHSTGAQISLSGAYMTMSSLSGSALPYSKASRYETVSYKSSTSGITASCMSSAWLKNPVPGVWMGANSGDFDDTIGGSKSEYAAVSFLIKDAAPKFGFAPFGTSIRNGLWFFPTFTPLGILNPGAPEKSAKITS